MILSCKDTKDCRSFSLGMNSIEFLIPAKLKVFVAAVKVTVNSLNASSATVKEVKVCGLKIKSDEFHR